jgi:hypothetical protein
VTVSNSSMPEAVVVDTAESRSGGSDPTSDTVSPIRGEPGHRSVAIPLVLVDLRSLRGTFQLPMSELRVPWTQVGRADPRGSAQVLLGTSVQ